MRIRATLVGVIDHARTLDWPEGWPVPREGESVDLPGLGGLSVRTVEWFPEGEEMTRSRSCISLSGSPALTNAK